MYTAVKGIYENGILTFVETPPAVRKSEVVVLFMDDDMAANPAGEGRSKGVLLGSLIHEGYNIPDDFDDSLDDLKDYM